MIAEAVISCPRCLRQYRADTSLDGKLGQCAACKAHFVVSVPRLANEGGEAVLFEHEIEPEVNFLRDGCLELARHCRYLLEEADLPITSASANAIVRSLPFSFEELASKRWQEGFCNQTLKSVAVRDGDSPGFRLAARYFLEYLPGRSFHALDVLQAAFIGVLDGLHLSEGSPPPSPPPVPERNPGPLERWAARRGW